jgi:hypothetical protein
MSDSTENGPNYGMGTILRGFPNFEDIYQGLPNSLPIALTPYKSGNQGRDKQAKKNYDRLSQQLAKQVSGLSPAAQSDGVDGATSPNLIEGLPMAFGVNAMFLLPRPPVNMTMIYQIVWRMLTPDTYGETSKPFQLSADGYRFVDQAVNTPNGFFPGVEGVFAGKAAERSLIFTVGETIRLTSPPSPPYPDPNSYRTIQTARDLGVVASPSYGVEVAVESPGEVPVPGFFQGGPVLPFVGYNGQLNAVTGKSFVYGEFGQTPMGAFEVGVGLGTGTPPSEHAQQAVQYRTQTSHVSYTTRAKGNECMVLAYIEPDGENWNFNLGVMNYMSKFFGRGGFDEPLTPNGIPYGVIVIPGWG